MLIIPVLLLLASSNVSAQNTPPIFPTNDTHINRTNWDGYIANDDWTYLQTFLRLQVGENAAWNIINTGSLLKWNFSNLKNLLHQGDTKMDLTTDGILTVSRDFSIHHTNAFRSAGHLNLQADHDNSGDGILYFKAGNDIHMTMLDNGNFGLGTTNPNIKLAIGDHDTGFNQEGDGQLGFYTNNTEKMRITDIGRVGIGTNNPTAELDINGNLYVNKHFEIAHDHQIQSVGIMNLHADQDGTGQEGINFRVANNTKMVLDHNGNLGIGTTSPNSKLDVHGNIGVNGSIQVNGSIAVTEDFNISYDKQIKSEGTLNFNADHDGSGQEGINFRVTNSTKMVLNNEGNLGVGTTSPSHKLDLNGHFNIAHDHQIQSDGILNLHANHDGTGNEEGINFRVSNNTRMVLDHNGNLGIGHSSPDARLDVNGDIRLDLNSNLKSIGHLNFQADHDGNGDAEIRFKAGNDLRMILDEHGNFGIGHSSPEARLDVNGDIRLDLNSNLKSIGHLNFQADHDGSGDAKIRFKAGNDLRMILDEDGNLGIGHSSPEAKLDVSGDIRIHNEGNLKSIGDLNLQADHDGSGDATIHFKAGNDIRMILDDGGRLGIGTTTPQSKLAVNGKATAKEVEVTANGWADFVFDDDYELPSLASIEAFIKANRHLPDVPSEREIMTKGLNLGDMDAILLQKIEELTLYLIRLQKENDQFRAMLENVNQKD